MYCTKCNINWARLTSQEGEDDEVYEVCPVCKNDMDLVENIAGDRFYYCPFSGDVINTKTQQPVSKQLSDLILPAITRPFRPMVSREEWQKKQVFNEAREDAFIEGYHQAKSSGASEDEAMEAAREARQSVKKL